MIGNHHLLVEAKHITFCQKAAEVLLTALQDVDVINPSDPDGSALPKQGPVLLQKYWPAVAEHMMKSLPKPQAGHETHFYVLTDDLGCLGATRSPISNLTRLLEPTHTVHPDHYIAVRCGTFDEHREHRKIV